MNECPIQRDHRDENHKEYQGSQTGWTEKPVEETILICIIQSDFYFFH